MLLSSRLMGEAEQICDRVGVIQRGKLVSEGTVAELRRRGGLLVRAEPIEQAAEVAVGISGVEGVGIEGETLRLLTDQVRAPEVYHELISAGIRCSELRPTQRSLEEAFFQLTEEEGE